MSLAKKPTDWDDLQPDTNINGQTEAKQLLLVLLFIILSILIFALIF